MEKTVLVWENDIGWCEQAGQMLAKEGIFMQEADTWESLERYLGQKRYLAAVLSLELLREEYGSDGWEETLAEFCRKSRIPVFLLDEEQKTACELVALRAGAFDYVSKEKDIQIFVIRLQRSFAFEKDQADSNTDYPDISEMLSAYQVKIGRELIFLTSKEALVLHCFLHGRGKIFSREEILAAVWGQQPPECRRVVDTIVKQLRHKIKETQYVIRSKYKLGYYFEKKED